MALEPYLLRFGDETSMPHCTCYDWSRSTFPCKHFLAIFQHYPAWSWESLPAAYRNSVFLILDETFEILRVKTDAAQQDNKQVLYTVVQTESDGNYVNSTNIEAETIDNAVEITQKESTDHDDVAKTASQPTGNKNDDDAVEITSQPTGRKIRDILTDIRRLSFLVETKTEIMQEVYDKLSSLRQDLYSKLPKEKGILLRKCQFAKRVGEQNEKNLKASKLKVLPQKFDNENSTLTEECVLNDDSKFGGDTFEDVVHQEILISSDDDIEEGQSNAILRQHLNKSDLKSLSDNEMLNDTLIHVFQSMIRGQYSDIDGLQDPVLDTKLSFEIYKNRPFIKILHNGNSHWVAVSAYDCGPNEIFYMDSLFHGKISDKVMQHYAFSIILNQN